MSVQEAKKMFLQDADYVWPYFSGLYTFFGRRSRKIEVYSFGLDNGAWEAEIAENTGCKVNIFDSRPKSQQKFETLQRILTTHKTEEKDEEYLSYFTKKWIQPTNLLFHNELPWTHNGTLETSEGSYTLKKVGHDTLPQLDVVKVSLNELSYSVVNTVLELGYRPGIFLIRWDEHPDKNTPAMITAGHLQTCGYKLLDSHNNCFIYIFVDQCMYEICSWARSDVLNPMFDEYQSGIVSTLLGKKETPVPKIEEPANDVSSSPPAETPGQDKQTS